MAEYRVSVENAAGTSGDTVVVRADNPQEAEAAALAHFPVGWVVSPGMTVAPATEEDRVVAVDLTESDGTPVVTQGPIPD